MSKLSIVTKVFSIVTILSSLLGFTFIFTEINRYAVGQESSILFGLSLAIIPYIITRSIKDFT